MKGHLKLQIYKWTSTTESQLKLNSLMNLSRNTESEPIASIGDISFAPSKLTRVATYPTMETNIGS